MRPDGDNGWMISVIDCSKKVLAVEEERNGKRCVCSSTSLHDDVGRLGVEYVFTFIHLFTSSFLS